MNKQQPERRARFVSLHVKLLIGFTVLFSVVFAIAFYWFYSFATDRAMRRIEEDMIDTLNGAIAGVNGDEFIALAREAEPRDDGLTDDPRYWQHLDWLETVHDIEPRANPYTYVEGEKPNETLFIGDILVITNPDNSAAFRESYISKGPMFQGLTDFTLHTEKPYTDKWGSWVSAYAPITNSKGEKVGAMGMDFRADYVFQVQQAIRDRVVIAFAITYTALFVLVFVISRSLTRPVIALTTAAEQVAEGDYDQNVSALYSGKLRDEVATLAQVFEMMISKVRQREESLKRQVQELRIEIDEAKKAKQVAEITETEYFQGLREHAARMRQRAKGE
jgi:HAMP domain-containing protein